MSAERPPDLTLIVPAYNEADRFPVGVARLQAAVDRGSVDPEATEIVVVDDGSTDGTGERARELLAGFPVTRFLRLAENTGKGAAVRAGVAQARAPVTLFTDADMAIDPEQIPSLTAALGHADVAIGSRAGPGPSVDYGSLRRTVMGRTFNRIVNATTHVSLDDTQCGFKAFRTPVARLLFHCSTIDRFAVDVELLSIARRLGLSIAEVPVRWRDVHSSRIRPWRDPLSMVSDAVLSRLGRRPPHPVDGAVVTAGRGGVVPLPAIHGAVGRNTVMVPWGRDGKGDEGGDGGAGAVLVLFTFAPAHEVEDARARLRAAVGQDAVRDLTVTVAELAGMAPLTVLPVPLPEHPAGGRE